LNNPAGPAKITQPLPARFAHPPLFLSVNEATKTWNILTAEERSWFAGSVLDIGCGRDKIVPHAKGFDVGDGDANAIDECIGDRFDMVFSSHCLEHMNHPEDAIQRWWRLVADGGRMIVIVPDEDLYEQGVYPSRFNDDHKATFTVSKRRSWSSRSYNMLELANRLPGARVLRCELQDQGYDRSRLTFGIQRTARIDNPIRLFLKRVLFRMVALDQTRGDPGALAQVFLAVEKMP
jgi:SAM-dependent methyltransferase